MYACQALTLVLWDLIETRIKFLVIALLVDKRMGIKEMILRQILVINVFRNIMENSEEKIVAIYYLLPSFYYFALNLS